VQRHLLLQRRQITAQAVFVLGSPAPYEVAITGGTGTWTIQFRSL
jgi:hypothetical protein